jgi:two-component system response regulator YesN
VYKVLLVDDEPMAVEGLRYIVDWGKLGFFVCATCGNGKEAVDAIDEYHPDVIITDIKMPVMDGLDLIQHTKEQGGENVKFIVVSGYAEFEYAKKAMQYGVRYYLQKPILKEEIDEIIIEVKEQLDQMQRSRKCSDMDQKAALDYVLSQILLGSNRPRDFEFVESVVSEETIMRLWNCVVIELEASDDMDIREESKNIRLKVRGAIGEAVKSYSDFFVLDHDLNKFIILLGLNNAEHENTINNVVRRVFQSLDSIVPFGFTIGVGENVEGIKGLKHSYDTARTALGHRFYMGLKCLIFYNEIKKKNISLSLMILSCRTKFLRQWRNLIKIK